MNTSKICHCRPDKVLEEESLKYTELLTGSVKIIQNCLQDQCKIYAYVEHYFSGPIHIQVQKKSAF